MKFGLSHVANGDIDPSLNIDLRFATLKFVGPGKGEKNVVKSACKLSSRQS